MAKKRYINTRFWDDIYISNLDPSEKLIFLYFLTNQRTDVSGIYEIPLKSIALDTGIDKEMVGKIIDRFSSDGKIYYIDGWVYVRNFSKHQAVNDSIKKGIERSMQEVPEEIKAKIKALNTVWGQTGDSLGGETDLLKLKLKPKPKLKPRPIGEESPKQKAIKFFTDEEEQKNKIMVISGKYEHVDINYIAKEISRFVNYWTELNGTGKKQRWEIQKTFEIDRRLTTWFLKASQYNQNYNKSNLGTI